MATIFQLPPPVLSTQVHAVKSARDLGVVIDSQLSLTAHVTALCQSGYYYLSQLRRPARVWGQPTRPHDAGPTRVALASGAPVNPFKLGCLMHKSLSGQAPQYLADDVQLVVDSGRRRLQSASDRTCVVPQTRKSFGDRSFSAAGPRVWNALPPELRHDISFGFF